MHVFVKQRSLRHLYKFLIMKKICKSLSLEIIQWCMCLKLKLKLKLKHSFYCMVSDWITFICCSFSFLVLSMLSLSFLSSLFRRFGLHGCKISEVKILLSVPLGFFIKDYVLLYHRVLIIATFRYNILAIMPWHDDNINAFERDVNTDSRYTAMPQAHCTLKWDKIYLYSKERCS